MTALKHTPGPWRTVPFICGGSRIGIQDADGKWVGEEGYAEVQYIPRFSPAHARRIVACVNACNGVSTEHLERHGLPDFAQKISDLVAQRDELLDALTKLVEDLEMRSNWKRGSENGVVDCGNSVYLKARSAIAKARGAA